MTDFKDEFAPSQLTPQQTPAQYIKLDDAVILPRDLQTYSEHQQALATKKLTLLSQIESRLSGGWTEKNLTPILNELFKDDHENCPSWRTVTRWYKALKDTQGSVSSLAEQHHRKGNRTAKVTGDEPFFEEALINFLDAKRPSIAKAYDKYEDMITIANEQIVVGKIPKVSYTSFAKRIRKLPPYEQALARLGKFKADQWFSYCASHEPPTRILQRVEIDHTPLDLIVVDDKLHIPLGRPYLTLIIDVYSGCILGFHISFHPPSYDSTAKAINHAIKPKDLSHLDIELQNEWPCYGKFETLVVDNGAEFWSKSLELACKDAGINIQYNPVRKPWLKPFIERMFGVINQLFLSEIPGKTFSNILEKGDYNPSKEAKVRFSTFINEFHRWVIDIYHQRPDSRKTRIPMVKWKESFEVLPPSIMTQNDELRFNAIMGKTYTRTLTGKGISYDTLRYDCTALADYRKRYPQSKETCKKTIKVDPDDITTIKVFLEELDGYLEVPCTEQFPTSNKISWYEYKTIRSHHRQIIDAQVDKLNLAKARMTFSENIALEQQFQTSQKKTKLQSAKNLARLTNISDKKPTTIVPESSEPLSNAQHAKKPDVFSSWDDDSDDLEAF
jgi:putative transposase